MATRPPTIYARQIDWPPSKGPDAAHYWVLDHDREKLVECDKEPHLLIPLKKVYEDPYGLTIKVKRAPIKNEDGCPLCHRLFVSQSRVLPFVKSQNKSTSCIGTNLHVILLCSAKKAPFVLPTSLRSKKRENGDSHEDDKLERTLREV